MEISLIENTVVHAERAYAARLEVAARLYGTSDSYIPYTP